MTDTKCNHCYCQTVSVQNGIGGVSIPHKKCCMCGDQKAINNSMYYGVNL